MKLLSILSKIFPIKRTLKILLVHLATRTYKKRKRQKKIEEEEEDKVVQEMQPSGMFGPWLSS